MKHKMAIVGFGGMAGWHYNEIQTIEGLEIAGIWDIREERRVYAAEEKGLHVYSGLEDLLADSETDLVLIATPNDVHKPVAIAAMEAGKNVVSEKPVTLCSQDLREMIETSDRTGRFLTVHQNRRWDEDFLTVKKILEEGKLGEVFRVESRVHGSRGIPGDWRQEKEHGGGMILDWGVHLLDQLLQLFSDVPVRSVYGVETHVTNQLVDDGFYAEIAFENGVTALVEVGTSNFVSLPRWYVLGADGTAVVEDWELHGKIVRATGVNEKDVTPVITAAGLTKTMAPRRDDSIFTEELPKVTSDVREFYINVMAVLEGREKSRIQLPEVMRVMKLMEAIHQSAETGEIVRRPSKSLPPGQAGGIGQSGNCLPEFQEAESGIGAEPAGVISESCVMSGPEIPGGDRYGKEGDQYGKIRNCGTGVFRAGCGGEGLRGNGEGFEGMRL